MAEPEHLRYLGHDVAGAVRASSLSLREWHWQLGR
jgi:hypothetical protein